MTYLETFKAKLSAMLFSPFGCIYQPTSPCPTLSVARTEPISLGHC